MKNIQFTLLTAICIATAFTFLACEEKDKKAEAARLEAAAEAEAAAQEASEATEKCPDETGPLQAEAVFLSLYQSDTRHEDVARFRLANGNEIELLGLCRGGIVYDLKEGDKVSITYQNEHYCWGDPDIGEVCDDTGTLKSVKILGK